MDKQHVPPPSAPADPAVCAHSLLALSYSLSLPALLLLVRGQKTEGRPCSDTDSISNVKETTPAPTTYQASGLLSD